MHLDHRDGVQREDEYHGRLIGEDERPWAYDTVAVVSCDDSCGGRVRGGGQDRLLREESGEGLP
jgi:hypothetical protein